MKKLIIPLISLVFILNGCSLNYSSIQKNLGQTQIDSKQNLIKQPVVQSSSTSPVADNTEKDFQTLIYEKTASTSRDAIYTNFDGSEKRKITDLESFVLGSIDGTQASPDGKKLAYLETKDNMFQNFQKTNKFNQDWNYEQNLYVKDSDGIKSQPLAMNINKDLGKKEKYVMIGWSYDNKIYFTIESSAIPNGTQYAGLWTFDVATGAVKEIDSSDEIFGGSKISPDGTKIAYEPLDKTTGLVSWRFSSPNRLNILDLATGQKETIATNTDSELHDSLPDLLWSKDSSKLIYKFHGETDEGFFVYDFASKKSSPVFSNFKPDNILAWFSNQRIAYVSRMDNNTPTEADDIVSLHSSRLDGSEDKIIDSSVGAGFGFLASDLHVPSIALIDTDGDGLSDQEEAVLGTNPNKVDTDGDSYSDYGEVNNLYNPVGPGKITEDKKLAIYKGKGTYRKNNFSYSLLYPAAWKINTSPSGTFVDFVDNNNNAIEISYEPYGITKNYKGIVDWYKDYGYSNNSTSSIDVVSKNGWQGIFSPNKNIFYLMNSNNKGVYQITFQPYLPGDLNLYNIFRLVINSFMAGK